VPNFLHKYWTRTKDNLTKAASDMKKTGGNSKPIEEAVKKFKSGFGPLLDDVGTAYKAKKDADVKKHAKAALDIANEYKDIIEAIPYECRIDAKQRLNLIIKNLTDFQKQGTAARDVFK
jgi:hypothetical protein